MKIVMELMVQLKVGCAMTVAIMLKTMCVMMVAQGHPSGCVILGLTVLIAAYETLVRTFVHHGIRQHMPITAYVRMAAPMPSTAFAMLAQIVRIVVHTKHLFHKPLVLC